MTDTKLKILTYNIHKAFHPLQRKYVFNELRELIRKSKADLVFLQEVQELENRKFTSSGRELETKLEFLSDTVWPHFCYGKNAIYPKGHHGNAILTKFPLIDWENFDISPNKFDKRGILYGRVEPPNTEPIHLFCAHLSLLKKYRKPQLKKLISFIREKAKKSPLILAGDFNDWQEIMSPILFKELKLQEAFLVSQGIHAKTFPSFFPFLGLDRIYFRGLSLLKSENDLPQQLSDHLPLSATLSALGQ